VANSPTWLRSSSIAPETPLKAGAVREQTTHLRANPATPIWPLASPLPNTHGELIPGPRTFATRKEAEDFLAEVQTDQRRRAWVDPRDSIVTLRVYSEEWLETRDLKATTLNKYRGLLTRHIWPKWSPNEWCTRS
jgi:hypothetical protein